MAQSSCQPQLVLMFRNTPSVRQFRGFRLNENIRPSVATYNSTISITFSSAQLHTILSASPMVGFSNTPARVKGSQVVGSTPKRHRLQRLLVVFSSSPLSHPFLLPFWKTNRYLPFFSTLSRGLWFHSKDTFLLVRLGRPEHNVALASVVRHPFGKFIKLERLRPDAWFPFKLCAWVNHRQFVGTRARSLAQWTLELPHICLTDDTSSARHSNPSSSQPVKDVILAPLRS